MVPQKFFNWLPDRKIAGAYVCGKWPYNIKLHKYLIDKIGNKKLNEKIRQLKDETMQGFYYELMRGWMKMGNLVERNEFKDVLNKCDNYRCSINILSKIDLAEFESNLHSDHIRNLWEWLGGITKGPAKLVAISKFLHHLIPNLVPPIDRKYTTKFLNEYKYDLFEHKIQFNNYRELVKIIVVFKDLYNSARNGLYHNITYQYADTSDTKTLDNWIIMWVDLKM